MPKRPQPLIGEDQEFFHPQKKSAVWRHFALPVNPTVEWQGFSRCMVDDCKAVFSLKGGGTSTMIRHLRTAHDMSYEFGERPMTPEDQRSLTYGLAVCILRDRISMFFVQSDGFRNWMQFVKPSFQVPHRTTIRYYIREACKLLKRDLRRRISQLKHICSKIQEEGKFGEPSGS